MLARSLDLGAEELAFSLEKPRTKPTHLRRGKNEPSETEHGTVIVARVRAAYVRADMSKFVEIGEIRHWQALDTRRPAPWRGPSEGGQDQRSLRLKAECMG